MSEPKPGMSVVHRSGAVDVLERRKSADSPIAGWWLRDGGGLADYALASDEWRLLDEDALRLLFPDGAENAARIVAEALDDSLTMLGVDTAETFEIDRHTETTGETLARIAVAALREAGLLPNRREHRALGVLVDGVLETDFHPAAKEAEYTCWVYDPSPWVPVSEESR